MLIATLVLRVGVKSWIAVIDRILGQPVQPFLQIAECGIVGQEKIKQLVERMNLGDGETPFLQ